MQGFILDSQRPPLGMGWFSPKVSFRNSKPHQYGYFANHVQSSLKQRSMWHHRQIATADRTISLSFI
jgi:hypothetical protein